MKESIRGLLVWLALLAGVMAAGERPNLVVILADDLGYSDLGCYGSRIQTPNVDGLAAAGLRFSNFYNTGRCWPTRTSLMTGYYYEQVDPKAKGTRMLPQYLKPLGYRSYHSGKWHVQGTQPCRDGGYERSFRIADHDRFFSPKRLDLDDKPLPPVEPGSDYYLTTDIAGRAIGFLGEHAEKHAEDPFFLYLAFTCPHFPLHALEKDIEVYRDAYSDGWDVERKRRRQRLKELGLVDAAYAPREEKIAAKWSLPEKELQAQIGPGESGFAVAWDSLTDEQKSYQATKMAIHSAMVHRMDIEIGRVIGQLKKMGAYDNTLIVFFADNGASAEQIIRGDKHDKTAPLGSGGSYLCLGPGWSTAANTPMRLHKHWNHEGGIATPMVAHWPKGITDRGAIRETPGHVVDLLPTLVDLAGGEVKTIRATPEPAPLPGVSLAPVFKGEGIEREFLYWNHAKNRALRIGDWKAVYTPYHGDKWELYHLGKDRGEVNDLAAKEPERLKGMVSRWEKLTERYEGDKKR